MTRVIVGWLFGGIASLAFLAVDAVAGPKPALQKLADELGVRVTKVLQAESAEPAVVAVAVEGDQAMLGKEGRIAQQLERLLVYRLEAGTAVERAIGLGAGQGVLALERARLSGATWLLYCVVGLKRGSIHLAADLTTAHVPFWDRLLDPVPRGARHHLFVSAKADAEIGLLLGKSRTPPALGSWHLDELLYVPQRVLDLGLGDIDGEQGAELVLLTEKSVEVFSFIAGKPKGLASYALDQVPRSRIQSRDPAGSLLVVDFNRDGRFEIFYKLFNFRWGEVLTFSGSGLRPLRRLEKVPLCQIRRNGRPVLLNGHPQSGTNRYRAELELTDINASSGEAHRLPSPFSTLRCWQRETDEPWVIAVDLKGNLFRLSGDWQVQSKIPDAGAGAGVLDLDFDGRADLVLSKPVWPGEADVLQVISQGEVVWRSGDVVGGVVAVAGGDLAGDGKIQAVVAAVESGGGASRVYLLGR